MVTLATPSESARTGVRRTFTNRFGFFSVPNVPRGAHTLTVSAVGYAPRTTRFEVSDSRTPRINIWLIQSEITLSEIMIEAQPSRNVRSTRGKRNCNPR